MELSGDGKLDALLMRFSHNRVVLSETNEVDPMGLLYVGTLAAEKGYQILVLANSQITPGKLKEIIETRQPRVIGFYVDHEIVHATMSLIDELKTVNEQLLCIVGGPQASVIPWDERILRESTCDIVVRGEGEVTFSEILDWYFKGNGSLEAIEGITYRENSVIKRTQDRPLLWDLDSLPFPDRSLNSDKLESSGCEALVTSRGCPHRCAFCCEGKREAAYRVRGIASVLAEIEELLKNRKTVFIPILDDTFTVNPDRVFAFCDGVKALQNKYHDFRWFCEARANVIAKHPEMVRCMVEAGLIQIQIGVESGNQTVLDAYHKDLCLEDIRGAVRICSEADVLSIISNFIIGGALESWDTIKNSIAFAEELLEIGLGRFAITTSIYTPYPGTLMSDRPEDFGIEILDPECQTGPGDNYCFVRTKDLSKWEILHARQLFMEAVTGKMAGLIDRVPDELFSRYFEASYRFGLQPIWLNFVSNYYNCYNYFALPFQGDYKYLRLLQPDEIEHFKPVRTCHIGTSHKGRLLLLLNDKKFALNDVSTFIYEHCYGRLLTRDIIDKVRQKFFPEEDREDIKSLVLEFFEDLDAEKLIVFTKL
ncbi:MAG TPA: PqqD family peptide modification chaperone [Nitrosomonas sp.]|nr:PqqD family peptide modification chaperone [Nitrosomonas sp.]